LDILAPLAALGALVLRRLAPGTAAISHSAHRTASKPVLDTDSAIFSGVVLAAS
jgi:hypothetical protein